MEDSWNRFKRLPQGYGLSGDVFIMSTDEILAVAPLATDSMDLENTVNDSWGSDKTVDEMVGEEKTKIMISGEATSTTLPSI